MFKPMLAEDINFKRLTFPVIVQPKIDGVRALNIGGEIKPRSLKKFANKCVNEMFRCPELAGFDGEMIVGTDPTASDLCRATTSALNTIEGYPEYTWYVFDYFGASSDPGQWAHKYFGNDYEKRRAILYDRISMLKNSHPIGQCLQLVTQNWVHTLDELQQTIERNEDYGYEGTIIRNPKGGYKMGRSTAIEGLLLRYKPFEMDDALVTGFTEELYNGNEAVTNALGYTERSTCADGMVGKGRVGTLLCRKIKDGKLTDEEIKVGPGRMTAEQKKEYFDNPELIVGKVVRYKHFPKGVKDKPRFPTYEYTYDNYVYAEV